jgi:hypothetical protein
MVPFAAVGLCAVVPVGSETALPVNVVIPEAASGVIVSTIDDCSSH